MNEQFTFFHKSDHPFSQWYMSDFEIDEISFNCAEQYMMYAKAKLFGDEEMAQKILETTLPGKQKAYGRLVKNFDSKIWDQEARKIVYKGNSAKFTQNQNLQKFLLKTAGTTLVEGLVEQIQFGELVWMNRTLLDLIEVSGKEKTG